MININQLFSVTFLFSKWKSLFKDSFTFRKHKHRHEFRNRIFINPRLITDRRTLLVQCCFVYFPFDKRLKKCTCLTDFDWILNKAQASLLLMSYTYSLLNKMRCHIVEQTLKCSNICISNGPMGKTNFCLTWNYPWVKDQKYSVIN